MTKPIFFILLFTSGFTFCMQKTITSNTQDQILGLSKSSHDLLDEMIKVLIRGDISYNFEPLILAAPEHFGKRYIAQFVAHQSKRRLFEPKEDDLFDETIEKSSTIKSISESALSFVDKEKTPVILLFSNIDDYARKTNISPNLRLKQLITQINKRPCGILPIMFSKNAKQLADRIVSKSNIIEIKYSTAERISLLKRYLENAQQLPISDLLYEQFGKATEGCGPLDIKTIAQSILNKENPTIQDIIEIVVGYFERKRFPDIEKRRALLRDSNNIKTFNDFIGLYSVISTLKAIMKKVETEKKSDFCIVFAGIPGTGKSSLAQALSYELKWPFYKKDVTEFRKGIVGSSAEAMRDFFDEVSRDSQPKVIFIDEIDILGGRQMQTNRSNEDNATMAQLWLCADDFLSQQRGIIIFATNNPENIDKALISRAHVINVPLPDDSARRSILEQCLKKRSDVDSDSIKDSLNSIARQTKYFAPRDLIKLVDLAVLEMYKEGSQKFSSKHFQVPISEVKDDIQSQNRRLLREFESEEDFDTFILKYSSDSPVPSGLEWECTSPIYIAGYIKQYVPRPHEMFTKNDVLSIIKMWKEMWSAYKRDSSTRKQDYQRERETYFKEKYEKNLTNTEFASICGYFEIFKMRILELAGFKTPDISGPVKGTGIRMRPIQRNFSQSIGRW